jgi:hypothetical protein
MNGLGVMRTKAFWLGRFTNQKSNWKQFGRAPLLPSHHAHTTSFFTLIARDGGRFRHRSAPLEVWVQQGCSEIPEQGRHLGYSHRRVNRASPPARPAMACNQRRLTGCFSSAWPLTPAVTVCATRVWQCRRWRCAHNGNPGVDPSERRLCVGSQQRRNDGGADVR